MRQVQGVGGISTGLQEASDGADTLGFGTEYGCGHDGCGRQSIVDDADRVELRRRVPMRDYQRSDANAPDCQGQMRWQAYAAQTCVRQENAEHELENDRVSPKHDGPPIRRRQGARQKNKPKRAKQKEHPLSSRKQESYGKHQVEEN